jgi:hypothetical protein
LRRMHLVFTRQFVERFQPFQGFQRHSSFELGTVAFSAHNWPPRTRQIYLSQWSSFRGPL